MALAAVMRTTGMLTTNNGVLRDRALALMSAQNRLVELQLAPPVATVSRDRAPCPQGGLALVCETRLTDVVRGSRLATVEVFRDRQAGPGWPRSARRWTIRDRPMDRRRQSGFSLIEVIVAIMIMAIISLLSWRAIDSVSLTSRKLDARSDEITALQRVFDQFERDVALRASPMQAAGQDFGGVAIRLRAAQSDLHSVELMRSMAGPAAGWQRVLWERDGRKLLRAAGPSGDRYPLAPPGPGETVLDEVQGSTSASGCQVGRVSNRRRARRDRAGIDHRARPAGRAATLSPRVRAALMRQINATAIFARATWPRGPGVICPCVKSECLPCPPPAPPVCA